MRSRISHVTRRRGVAKFGWGVADQSLSSLTNFITAALVARAAGVEEFGVFAVAFATYTLCLGTARSITGEPLVARFSGVDEARWRDAVKASVGVALLLGFLFALLAILCSVTFLTGSFSSTFFVLGLTFPGLILQDAWRHAFFASGHQRRAFANDSAWAILLVIALVIVLLGRRHSASAFMLAWGVSASGAAAVGCLQARLIPHASRALPWLKKQSDLSVRFLGEFLALTGATQFMLYGLVVTSGVEAVGALRAGMVAMGPVNILLMGVTLVGIPEAVAIVRKDGDVRRFCMGLSMALAVAAFTWGTVVMVMPEQVGAFVLGETWQEASSTLLPLTLWIGGNALVAGALTGLRALQAAGRSLRAQVVSASARFLLGLSGGAVAGAVGAAWGVAGATLFTSAIWWHQLSGAIAQREAETFSSRRGSGSIPRPERGLAEP